MRTRTIPLTHLAPIDFTPTGAQAQWDREDAILREALGLPKRDAVAMVVRDCHVTEAFALVLLDRFAASERDRMRAEYLADTRGGE